jgi:hypothetical protein
LDWIIMDYNGMECIIMYYNELDWIGL